MKTAVTVLQEMMVKMGETPEYECICQSGQQHQAMFEFICRARGLTARATARSKKEAKQEVARVMLQTMAARGEQVPHPYGSGPGPGPGPARGAPATAKVPLDGRSSVALLGELCMEYRLGAVEYELVGDVGPPHARQFTQRARLGGTERIATATTKKAARQQAAHDLYTYLRENLGRLTADFVEEEALVRAHERAMERYVETRDESAGSWRPDLGQRIADYHLGLVDHIDAEKRAACQELISSCGSDAEPEQVAAAASAALGLRWASGALPGGGPGALVGLSPTAPPLLFAGRAPRQAARTLLRYLTLALQAER